MNKMLNDLWDDICPGFYNFGRLPPDTDVDSISDLVKANEEMIDYIIADQEIGPESRILDLGCGKGGYTVGIAKRTGCQFVGTDIEPGYIDECRELARVHGVDGQGVFQVNSFMDIDSTIKEKEYTHVLVLGAMLYAHGAMDIFLNQLISCCDKNTKIFIWDLVRNVEWEDCRDANRHLKMSNPLLTKEKVLENYQKAGLELIHYEDATKFIVPGNKFLIRECKKRDPDMLALTNPLLATALVEGILGYYYYCLKIKP
jgi:cyclopropane fatty-acyl-phospholipid synthase-like methyltransferase